MQKIERVEILMLALHRRKIAKGRCYVASQLTLQKKLSSKRPKTYQKLYCQLMQELAIVSEPVDIQNDPALKCTDYSVIRKPGPPRRRREFKRTHKIDVKMVVALNKVQSLKSGSV